MKQDINDTLCAIGFRIDDFSLDQYYPMYRGFFSQSISTMYLILNIYTVLGSGDGCEIRSG